MSAGPIVELHTILGGSSMPAPKPGDYMAYLDEEDPGGGVGFFREDGTPLMWMTTAAYEAFRAWGVKEHE